jgi:hypothetical protein
VESADAFMNNASQSLIIILDTPINALPRGQMNGCEPLP